MGAKRKTFVMLLVEDFFKTFVHKPIADASKSTESIIALSADSKAEVDELFRNAMAAGGKETNPVNDQGFMYSASFMDLDSHQWEVFYMDVAAIAQAQAQGQAKQQQQQQQ